MPENNKKGETYFINIGLVEKFNKKQTASK